MNEILTFGGEDTKLDPSVHAALPEGCRVMSVEPHGVSFWASVGRIDVELMDSSTQSFFIKVMSGTAGGQMVHAEFESMSAIFGVTPEFVPKPIAHGQYSDTPDTHFFLCEFREMDHEMPDPHMFTDSLAHLHQKSESPNGKFGFHITTYSGNLPQAVGWESSWLTFFTRSLQKALELEIAAKGPDKELQRLIPILFEKVVPRLLGPLEAEGRTVKPSLVHGDLWYANSGIDLKTGKSLVFDACCFYAHNEYEFGQWRPACNRFGDEYLEAYHSRIKISPPEEDYNGRLDLYKLRFNTHVSALFTDNQTLREQMLGDIRDLVQRYG